MIQRFIEGKLQRLAVQFPVITITGPRQSGKTTLAQYYFKGYDYVNLEDPDIWNQVHRIAGPLWIIGGYVVALEAFFLPRRWIGPVMLGIIFLLSAFSIIHAWLLAGKKTRKKRS